MVTKELDPNSMFSVFSTLEARLEDIIDDDTVPFENRDEYIELDTSFCRIKLEKLAFKP